MAGLTQQFELATELSEDINRVYTALKQTNAADKNPPPALKELDAELIAEYNSIHSGLYGGGEGNPSIMATPTTQQVSLVAELHRQVNALLDHQDRAPVISSAWTSPRQAWNRSETTSRFRYRP